MARTKELKATCMFCKKEITLLVEPKDYVLWIVGSGYIQNLFPYLSPGERELLISRTCETCFDNMFKEKE